MNSTSKDEVSLRGRVVVVLTDVNTGEQRIHVSTNIITDAGDLYYAERGSLRTISGSAVVPVPTNFTDTNGVPDMIMELYDNTPANGAPAKGNNRSNLLGTIAPLSAQPIDATYPQVDDQDGRNTGADVDVVTYRVSYTTAQANLADITDVILTNPTPGASEPLIMHAEFPASFTKTVSDTLAVFVNHQMNGVP